MRKLPTFIAAGCLVGAVGMAFATPAHAQEFSIDTGSLLIRAPIGSTTPLLVDDVPAELVGATCSASSAEVLNQDSVHQGNDIIVLTGNDSVRLEGVEDTPGQVVEASGSLTMGTFVEVDLVIGNTDASDNNAINPDTGQPFPPGTGTFSAGLRLIFNDCVLPTTTTSTTTEPGQIAFDFLDPVCIDDFPFISYQVSGDVEPGDTATVTVTDINGTVVTVVENQPLSGQVLWPGASVDPPDWPGWILEDGVWVVDPTDDVLREDLTITVDVNPTATETVAYPSATSECANTPDSPPPTTTTTTGGSSATSTTTPTLPATGGDRTTNGLLIAILLLTAGGAILTAVRRQTS
jgi:LPXTG-motif cell wall-anchored protein